MEDVCKLREKNFWKFLAQEDLQQRCEYINIEDKYSLIRNICRYNERMFNY